MSQAHFELGEAFEIANIQSLSPAKGQVQTVQMEAFSSPVWSQPFLQGVLVYLSGNWDSEIIHGRCVKWYWLVITSGYIS